MNGDGSTSAASRTDRARRGPWFSPMGRKSCSGAGDRESRKSSPIIRALLKDELWRPTTLEIFVMDRDGRNFRQVTKLGGANFAPAWHPDGKRLIFASNINDPKGRDFDLFLDQS